MRILRSALVLAGAIFWLTQARQIPAQQLASVNSTARPQVRDSAAAVRKARSLQAGFESRRRQLLPRFYTGSADRCLIIGRFCYWNSETPDDLIPDEGDNIRRARAKLLRDLESVAAAVPSDDWVVGQRIRYLLETRDTSAMRVARDCAGTRWWCDALAGYTLHVRGDFAAADSAFARALSGMPSAMRCDWIDVSTLLESDLRKEFRRLPCDQREAQVGRIWWLADPLFMTPGNERRTEHFSRVVYAALHKDAANTYGLRWGDDLAELVLRFGWSEKWTRRPAENLYSGDRPAITGHDAGPGFHFIVKRHPPDRVELVADSVWELERSPPRELYAPAYARAFTRLDAQVARFRRGDSTLVIAAYDVSEDTLFRGRSFTAGLTVMGDEARAPVVREVAAAPLRHAMTLMTASKSQLVGVELLASDSGGAARWRSGYAEIPLAPDGVSVSDLLFFDSSPQLPDGLDEAVTRAHGGNVFSRSEKVGLFWELYGKAPVDTTVPVSLTISPLDAGFFRSALRALRIAPKATPLNIRWQENGASGVLSARSVLLDLSLVPPGKYEVKLEVGAARPARARASKVIQVR